MAMFDIFRSDTDVVDTSQLRRIEEKLDLVLSHLGLTYDDPGSAAGLSEEVKDLCREAKVVAAIKLYRAQTGAGLKEAKDAIEGFMATSG